MDPTDWRAPAEEGRALIDERLFAEAVEPLCRAVELEPGRWALWADLAVATKHSGDFRRCLEASTRAAELGAGGDEGVFWNMAVAATALGEWRTARRGWLACGLPLPGGEGDDEVRWDLGPVPIRLAPRGEAEVVWCDRICPARAVIRSVPTPESGRRCGDLVLHDGEPRGSRIWRGKELAVFDELALLERSARETYVAEVVVESEADLEALVRLLTDAGHIVEDWTATLQVLCRACSEGRPHARHDRELAAHEWVRERRIAIASERGPDHELTAWLDGSGTRQIERLVVPA